MKRCISDSVLQPPGRPNMGPLSYGPTPDYNNMSSSFSSGQPYQDFPNYDPGGGGGMRRLPEYDLPHPNSIINNNRPPPSSMKPMMMHMQQQQQSTRGLPPSDDNGGRDLAPKSNNWMKKELNDLTERYRDAVWGVAQRYLSNMDEKEVYIMKQMFSEWKSERDKLDVNNMYKLPGWRAIYTKSLFLSRIQTVEFSITRVLYINSPKKILLTARKYVSLGCGPGPCVGAVLMVLRSELRVTHHIDFVGVDQFIGWKPYIESLSNKDNKSTVKFKQMRVDESTLEDLPPGEVAIMSYTDASIHTPAFWEGMRKRYQLILILDQNKSKLHSLLVKQKFRPVEYVLKGRKRFYYQVSDIVSKDVLESKRSKGPPLVKIPTDDDPVPPKSSKESEEESVIVISDTKSEPSDDGSDVIPLNQMLELKAMEDMVGPVQKTKCGTQSGRYSGALEPQKKMTTERMNQLLKAKLKAMEESGIDVNTNDSASEASIDSPSTVTSEAGDDTNEEFNILDSEEFRLLDSIDLCEEDGTVTFDSFQPVVKEKLKDREDDNLKDGQSIPVITNATKSRQNLEFPNEFLDELFNDDSSDQSDPPPSTTTQVTTTAANTDNFDLRDILKRKRKFSEIGNESSLLSTATPVKPLQKTIPIKMECNINMNRGGAKETPFRHHSNYSESSPFSSLAGSSSKPQSIQVVSSSNIIPHQSHNNNHFKQPRRFSTGAAAGLPSRNCDSSPQPNSSLLGVHPQSNYPPSYVTGNTTATAMNHYMPYQQLNYHQPAYHSPPIVTNYNTSTLAVPPLTNYNTSTLAPAPLTNYNASTLAAAPLTNYNASTLAAAPLTNYNASALTPAPPADTKAKDLRELLNARRNGKR